MLSHRYRCIFVHIPKSGGTSIKQAFNMQISGRYNHKDADASKQLYRKDWDQYFKFTFVRNPGDRVVSIYSYYKYVGDKHNAHIVVPGFSEFVETLCADVPPLGLQGDFAHPKRGDQYNGTTVDGKLNMDFVGRFENFKEDFVTVCTTLNVVELRLPHVRKSPHDHYRDYYSTTTKKLVEQRFTKDIEEYEYVF